MRSDLQKILLKYIKMEINKDEMKKYLEENKISVKEFNKYVAKFIKKLHSVSNSYKNLQLSQECKISKKISTDEFLDENFISEIENQIDQYKTTDENDNLVENENISEDMSFPDILSIDQKDLKYYTVDYNILSSKINRLLSFEDLQNRLARIAKEANLNPKVDKETIESVNNAMNFYIKHLIMKALKTAKNKNITIEDLKNAIKNEEPHHEYPDIKDDCI
ncbi:hypothetical protein CWI37_1008p0020 [Hamiltosporidium tvaerminnensis]|uniref:Uncharacterized protein n=1 Tax=Hamiltosporidium tvaerminnensis TaxID=1176355 RepID=A0A4Q9L0Y8_9MICR|nr:hypothetical protein CWI37_1008p0020 [Hamiltosporidium tvaerminnensis]